MRGTLVQKLVAFAAAVAFVHSLPAQSVAILDNSGASDDLGNFVNPGPIAQRFTMPANGVTYTLTDCTLYGVVALTPSAATAAVSLWTDAGGDPGAQITVLGVTNVTQSGVDPKFTPTNTILLVSGQTYYVRVEAPDNYWVYSATTYTSGSATGLGTFGNHRYYYSGAWNPEGGTMKLKLNATVAAQPQLVSPLKTNGNFTFSVLTVSNQNYTVQYNTNLATTNWIALTNFTGNGSPRPVSVAATNKAAFFRVR